MTETFFHAGSVYRRQREGTTAGEDVFVVACVGRAPLGFGSPREAHGVAFGWRRGPGPDGPDQPLGSYMTHDFAGWEEVPDTELPDLVDSPIPVEAARHTPRGPTGQRHGAKGRTPKRHWWRRPD
ncbi:hypothetical protein [Kitasatospora paranensis]|uniref:Uncharacterized protein n=2 Tax=Kitasatospora paranensis TaxID=258053 RepID=A0ABW2FU65_9ACTN